MPALFFFAFLSGLVTILAPCIWPILPIVLSASATGGHKKPLGITLGVVISFFVLTLSISYIVKIIPFDTNYLRLFAAFVIGLLGFTLIIPKLSGILEGYVSRLSGKLKIGSSISTNNGFWSGFVTGIALGVVWTPCAGPILATIAVLASTQKVNLDVILVTFFYVFGVGIPLFIFATLGRLLFTKTRVVSKYTGLIQRIFGVIMIITALLIVTNYDKIISAKLLDYVPSYSAFLNKLEGVKVVQDGLSSLKGGSKNDTPSENSLFNVSLPSSEFVGISTWLNTDGKKLTMKDLKGKVVLVDFWTYTCINCIRTLPYVTSWYNKYNDKGFVVVGIHTPEFDFEKKTQNVENAIKQYKIFYPVGQDNDYATWNNFSNQYWPAEYLIDSKGVIRRTHFGEGEYDQMEKAIQILLKEKGEKIDTKVNTLEDQTPQGQISPETYLGSRRMEYLYPNGGTTNGIQNFKLQENIPVNSFSFGGEWNITDEYALAKKGATLEYHFNADKVFLVMNGGKGDAGNPLGARVLLDGKDISADYAGSDVKNSVVEITTDKLYNLVDFHGKNGNHVLKLIFDPGVSAFAFTFG